MRDKKEGWREQEREEERNGMDWPGVVVHACGMSSLDAEIGGLKFEANLWKKISEIPFQQTSQRWWFVSVISTMQMKNRKIVV
jgi:hypothetical protein